MSQRSFEATEEFISAYKPDARYMPNVLLVIDMLNQIQEKDGTDVPFLSELLPVENKKLDVTWMPEGSEPLAGWFHLEGYEFVHKDSKDPQLLIEELPDGQRKYHIYFSRGIAHDIIIDTKTGEVNEDSHIENVHMANPIIEEVERWEVGHLISDDVNGPWTEVETAKIHDVIDKPQMCAPSVFFENGRFHMVIQGACFFDNHPIYHFTSTNGTDFNLNRTLLLPIPGSSEAGLYDVDTLVKDDELFIVYSAMAPMTEKRKAINEIHLAYVSSLDGLEEAERLVELEKGLWARIVKLNDTKYAYYPIEDTGNTSRIIRTENGTHVSLKSGSDGSRTAMEYINGKWTSIDAVSIGELENVGYLSSPQPGSPIVTYLDIPQHNTHPPAFHEGESEVEQFRREQAEANFEWGLEGMQILELPNGLYLMLGVCFLKDKPIGERQRAFMAVSEKITGPFIPIGQLVDPSTDFGWGEGENGHASAQIIGDKLHIFYQARNPFRRDSPLEEQLSARWQLGEAVCALDELCRVAENTFSTRQTTPALHETNSGVL